MQPHPSVENRGAVPAATTIVVFAVAIMLIALACLY